MKYISFMLLFFLANSVFAQKYTISGFVSDDNSGEKLIGSIVTDGNNSTITNKFGYYTLRVNSKSEIKVSYIGFLPYSEVINFGKDSIMNFDLKSNNDVSEITVKGTREITETIDAGLVNLSMKEVKLMPALGGELDLFKIAQLMPGIQQGSEGRNALFVRGGTPDQNLILLDDVPLYSVSHLGGLVSIFNPDAIKHLTINKGTFSAKYGGRLSSLVDVRMRDGNMKKHQAQISAGLISSRISIEGPIFKNKTSYIFSARRFMLDLITMPLSKNEDGFARGYTFYDINSKISHTFSHKSRVYLSLYFGNDKIKFNFDENETKIKSRVIWGNSLVSARWNYVLSKKLFMNFTLAYTNYKYKLQNELKYKEEYAEIKYNSGINDNLLKLDFEYTLTSKTKFSFGINSSYNKFSPEISSLKKQSSEKRKDVIYSNELTSVINNSLYVDYEQDIFEILKFSLGVRAVSYFIENNNYTNLNPRLRMNAKITGNFSVKASYSKTSQNLHRLVQSKASIPADFWLPATKYALPEKANQINFGTAQTFFNNNYEFTIDAYYKTMQNLITYKEGIPVLLKSSKLEDRIEVGGTGKSEGLEFLLRKKEGEFTGWLSYTLSQTTRKFENINNGKEYPFEYDRRHNVNIVFNYRIKKNVYMSASWTYSSGRPFDLAYGYFSLSNLYFDDNLPQEENKIYGNKIRLYGTKNGFKMRAYHRLDLGINFIKKKKYGTRTWSVSLYNAYNRKNPYFYYFSNQTGETKLYQKSYFPIIPSFSYSFKFHN